MLRSRSRESGAGLSESNSHGNEERGDREGPKSNRILVNVVIRAGRKPERKKRESHSTRILKKPTEYY